VIPEIEPQPALPVDQQLLNLADSLKGTIITNDWNMAQIAGLQGMNTLNINELTYELRPLILPRQTIRVSFKRKDKAPDKEPLIWTMARWSSLITETTSSGEAWMCRFPAICKPIPVE
jgi:hypothetical protein